MSYDAYYQGTVPLKDGVTLQQVVALYNEHTACLGPDDAPSELPLEPEGDYRDDDVWLTVKDGELEYAVDANVSSGWDFEAFLQAITAECAAKGWISYEGSDRDEVFYGPSPRAVLESRLEHAIQERDWAEEKIKRLQKELADV